MNRHLTLGAFAVLMHFPEKLSTFPLTHAFCKKY